MVRGMWAKYPGTTKYLLVSCNNLGKMSNSRLSRWVVEDGGCVFDPLLFSLIWSRYFRLNFNSITSF